MPAEDPNEVLVYAASSLQDLVSELGGRFEQERGTRVVFNFAGSNTLAQQITATPQADIFLSADQQWVAYLEDRGLIQPGSKRALLTNHLVVVAHADSTFELDSAEGLASLPFTHLVLGDVEAVPAGRYAKAWLSSIALPESTLWEALSSRVVPTPDVRAALALVESDPGLVGIVYATDLLQSKGSKVLLRPAPEEQPRILYSAVRLKSERGHQVADVFYDWLFDPVQHELIEQFGFEGVR